MSYNHKNPTVSFRPSEWERALIEERASMSGMQKKDFIARSCIYSNIVVVGKRETVQNIVDATENLIEVFKDIVGQLESGDISFSQEIYADIKNDALATAITIVDILNGAAYLFDKKPPPCKDYKKGIDVDSKQEYNN